jgi:hypothetical protein
MKMMAMIRMTTIDRAKAMTTGRKDESLLRASGVGVVGTDWLSHG